MKNTKTNKKWYLYEEFGCYLKLDDDILIAHSMTDEEDIFDVDWDYGVEPKDRQRLKAIVEELEQKE